MSRTQRLLVVLALNLALVVGLVAVGVTAHSLAVLAAGGDYLLDAAAVGVALLAIPVVRSPCEQDTAGGWRERVECRCAHQRRVAAHP